MRESLQKRLEEEHHHGIDLSPLIDVVFILLIFFIITTVFVKESGVEIERPQAVTTQELVSELIILAITEDGNIIYDGSNIGVDGVRPLVSALMNVQERPVVIQGDKNANIDLLVQVIDQARLGGANSVNISTEAMR